MCFSKIACTQCDQEDLFTSANQEMVNCINGRPGLWVCSSCKLSVDIKSGEHRTRLAKELKSREYDYSEESISQWAEWEVLNGRRMI